MNKSPSLKKELGQEELNIILGYQSASKSKAFMDTLKKLYASCRKKAQEGIEKNKGVSDYWNGRADAYELLIDNCTNAENVNLRSYQ